MPPVDVNPQSSDAWFARIDQRLTDQEKTLDARLTAQDRILVSIDHQVKATNGRVTKLEIWRAALKAKKGLLLAIAGASGAVLGWYFESGAHLVFAK